MYNSMIQWNEKGVIQVHLTPKQEAYVAMSRIGLPVVSIRSISSEDFSPLLQENLEAYIRQKQPHLLIAKPRIQKSAGFGQSGITSIDEVTSLLTGPDWMTKYDVSLVQMVDSIPAGFVGTAIHTELETFIEILSLPNGADVRELTSKGADPSRIVHGRFFGRHMHSGTFGTYLEDMCTIRSLIEGFAGYYEFVKGSVGGETRIWFTDYQQSPEFQNLLNP